MRLDAEIEEEGSGDDGEFDDGDEDI
jgi:hypothetical protein